jgi:CheY-like chemotaxis protein/two-component sensor histidine kinase
VNLEDCLLAEPTAEVVSLFRPLADQKGLKLRLDVASPGLFARVDKKLYIGIVNNLLNNAVKFTLSGSVTVSLSSERDADGKDLAILTVKDTGIGIPEERLYEVFDEFRQVSEGFGRSFDGTGLGLSITKKYTELMDGQITARSTFGEGTEFIVSFPLSNNAKQEIRNESKANLAGDLATANSAVNEFWVLITEDDSINCLLCERILSNLCYVEFARSADEAIEKAGSRNFDLILMDINLGTGRNGIEAVADLRRMENCSNVPIVALTAFAMAGDSERLLGQGFSDYLAKPFEPKDLSAMVKKYMENKS